MSETKGHRSSERRLVLIAFWIDTVLIALAMYLNADLASLSASMGAKNTLIIGYVMGRSYVKGKQGE